MSSSHSQVLKREVLAGVGAIGQSPLQDQVSWLRWRKEKGNNPIYNWRCVLELITRTIVTHKFLKLFVYI